jgi:RNA recognition motif-containing protein
VVITSWYVNKSLVPPFILDLNHMLQQLGHALHSIVYNSAAFKRAPRKWTQSIVSQQRSTTTVFSPSIHVLAVRQYSSFLRSSADLSRCIWIGGLPYKTTKIELQEMFSEFGTVESLHMPTRLDGRPKGTCMITFSSDAEAKSALAMDGKMCGDRWMRVNLPKQIPFVDENLKPDGCKKIFFSNIPFKVNEDQVRSIFQHCGDIVHVSIVKDFATNSSRGFGFIEFHDTEATDKAVKLCNTYIDGRLMNVKYATERSQDIHSTTSHNSPGRTVLVAPEDGKTVYIRNFPKDIEEETLQAMFEHCGDIHHVNLALDNNGTPRGFAHITFGSKEGAQKAITLSGCEMDGHKMVVQMAMNKRRMTTETSSLRHEETTSVF